MPKIWAEVQLGDYSHSDIHTILWGLYWWGSKAHSQYVRELFLGISDPSQISNEKSSRGATGTVLRRTAKRLKAEDVLRLQRDIKEIITEDLVSLPPCR